ncbi:MAG: ABC transporter ATP-binding protein [Nitrospirae bacterium]|nr:ABC transporter ATP-binding protein [Candidatus Troglogloeales bacterium]MBI3598907.1 ABC transporter ATP-binding protein [Candidatus Troglogloeales bacterium]
MITLSDIAVSYGSVSVLKGISLEIKEGEVVTLIGANGAGKTTMLMTISGIVPSLSGTMTLCGETISGLPPHDIVQKGISQVPEGRRIFPELTILENLEMGAFLERNIKRKKGALDEVFSFFPVLFERRSQRGGTLSGGEQQMLAIGRALMARPKLLLLDEPSLGLSPVMVGKIFEMIKGISRQGKTIFLVEQNAYAALALADRGYVMETGKIVLFDSAPNLLKNPMVQSAYLGGMSI